MASSLLIMMVEPADSALTRLDQALWWSVVTSTTVGYGDLYPVSTPGKIVAVFLPMFMGIGLGAAFITHVASALIERRDRKMHGEKKYDGSHHILIVGVTDETEHLIAEIQRDDTYLKLPLVVVADRDRHPFPDMEHVFFVKGRPDASATLTKAGIHSAGRIIIHTGNDEESLFALINALKLKNETCDITVRCLNSQSLDTFSSVPGNFQTIMQMTAEMMVQAMQDKVHLPLQVLLRNDARDEIYYVSVPQTGPVMTWWELHTRLKETYNFLTFAMQTSDSKVIINPDAAQAVTGGDGIWLMAQKRPLHIDWS
ncbi:MAG: NAD-binding protein [Desulfotignum sp.]|nr:NAD-binding protein [Desulfotignum sp.]MCF8087474.1 NAD-binding protein [Desulfotignum sp.]MCF8138997.1 NAD-binding protein [Desulfotignum sp.]